VVVLGAAIAESLFPDRDPLGQTVRLNGAIYEVIGVFPTIKDSSLGPGVDIFAIIPLSNSKSSIPKRKS